jgi:hypothetical protein
MSIDRSFERSSNATVDRIRHPEKQPAQRFVMDEGMQIPVGGSARWKAKDCSDLFSIENKAADTDLTARKRPTQPTAAKNGSIEAGMFSESSSSCEIESQSVRRDHD